LLIATILPYSPIGCNPLLISGGRMGLTTGRRTLFAAVCAVAVASIYAAQPVLAQIGNDLGVPDARLGWIVAAGQLGYLAGLAVLVPLGDMTDRRKLMVGHLLLSAVGAVLAATATRTWMLLGGLVVTGLFAVVVQTTVAYAAALSTPEERGRNLGVVTCGVVIGILGARVAAGALAAAWGWGWRSVYVALAVSLVMLACLVLKALPPDTRADHATYRQVLRSLSGLFRERLFLSRGLIAFFLFASFGTLWSGLALPLAAAPWHLSTAQIGLFGLAGLAGTLGAGRAGRWADAGFASAVRGAGRGGRPGPVRPADLRDRRVPVRRAVPVKKRTAQALAELFGTPLSGGTVASLTQRAAGHLDGFLAHVRDKLTESEVVGFDETGLRVAGKLHWVHCARTDKYTLVTVTPSAARKASTTSAFYPASVVSPSTTHGRHTTPTSTANINSVVLTHSGSCRPSPTASRPANGAGPHRPPTRWCPCRPSSATRSTQNTASMKPSWPNRSTTTDQPP
jgi:predicted MFS family arabinose efflux permease